METAAGRRDFFIKPPGQPIHHQCNIALFFYSHQNSELRLAEAGINVISPQTGADDAVEQIAAVLRGQFSVRDFQMRN